jgi:DNA-binding MarR family transcriptional regulator
MQVRRKRPVAQPATSKSEAVADLMLEVAQFFFRIRAVGQKTGLITGWGGGAFGFMRSLVMLGPLTVPQIAEMRPTSRQRMQRLADELVAEGLVEFADNPKHRRSKLVQLTPKGEARYREWNTRFLEIGSAMGAGLSEAEIRKTVEIVRRLSAEVKAQTPGAAPIGGRISEAESDTDFAAARSSRTRRSTESGPARSRRGR